MPSGGHELLTAMRAQFAGFCGRDTHPLRLRLIIKVEEARNWDDFSIARRVFDLELSIRLTVLDTEREFLIPGLGLLDHILEFFKRLHAIGVLFILIDDLHCVAEAECKLSRPPELVAADECATCQGRFVLA